MSPFVRSPRRGGHLFYDTFNQLNEARWIDIIGNDYVKFGYNVGGERVYKQYKYYYRDSCDVMGGPLSPLDPEGSDGDSLGVTTLGSGTLPPDDTLCIFSKTTSTRYVRSKGKVLVEYVGSPIYSRQFAFIYAGNQRIAMIDSEGKLHFYLNDHLGSARMVIDTTGTVKDNYDYYAFGEALNQTVSTGQSYGYTGKPFDNDHSLNLHYYGARYYDATIGRFPSVDPRMAESPSWSPYAYALDNPMRLVDPNGMESEPNPMTKQKLKTDYVQTLTDAICMVATAVNLQLTFGASAGAGPVNAGTKAVLQTNLALEVSGGVQVSATTPAGELKTSVMQSTDGTVTFASEASVPGLKAGSEFSYNPNTGAFSSDGTAGFGGGGFGLSSSVSDPGALPKVDIGVEAGIGVHVIIDPSTAKKSGMNYTAMGNLLGNATGAATSFTQSDRWHK